MAPCWDLALRRVARLAASQGNDLQEEIVLTVSEVWRRGFCTWALQGSRAEAFRVYPWAPK